MGSSAKNRTCRTLGSSLGVARVRYAAGFRYRRGISFDGHPTVEGAGRFQFIDCSHPAGHNQGVSDDAAWFDAAFRRQTTSRKGIAGDAANEITADRNRHVEEP